MPVILRINGYRVWFYSSDLIEPPHVHVGKENKTAKFWMTDIAAAESKGFQDHERNQTDFAGKPNCNFESMAKGAR